MEEERRIVGTGCKNLGMWHNVHTVINALEWLTVPYMHY